MYRGLTISWTFGNVESEKAVEEGVISRAFGRVVL